MVRVLRPGVGHVAGLFPSYKMYPQAVPYESTIERDLLYFLEFDPAVRRYQSQPFTITGPTPDGVLHTYTPDYLVERITRSALIECKPVTKTSSDHTRQQIILGTGWAATHDHDFVLITDADLRTGPRLANLKLLYRYRRQAVPVDLHQQCTALLAGTPVGIPVVALTAALAGTASAYTATPYVYSLLFHHYLVTDLDQPLGPKSLITRPAAAGSEM